VALCHLFAIAPNWALLPGVLLPRVAVILSFNVNVNVNVNGNFNISFNRNHNAVCFKYATLTMAV
jgi:hypothetical protein